MDWKELTTNDKAELISLFVKNGITDINQMRKLYANGGDKTTLNNPRYNRDAEDRIYAYLRDEGLSHSQASAFMGNIAVESLLNADINQEKKGPAKGLLQTEPDRYKKLQQYNEIPYKFGIGLTPDEQHQLDYFINKGVKNYTSGEWGRKRYKGKDYKSARDARKDFNNPNRTAQELSDILMKSYFRPGKPQEWRRDKMTDYFYNEMPTRFPYFLNEYGKHYYDKDLNIFDTGGSTNNEEPILDEYSGGILNSSSVSATLSRDQWNNLYKQGKVELTQIPRKYQSWIEGENSQFKRDIQQSINNAGPVVTGVLGGSAGLAALMGSSPIWTPYVASTIKDVGKTVLNLYNPEAYATTGLNIAKGIAKKLGPQALSKVVSATPIINDIGKGLGYGVNLYFTKEGLENVPYIFGEYSNIYNSDDNYLNKAIDYTNNTIDLGLNSLGILGGIGSTLQLGNSVVTNAPRLYNDVIRKPRALGRRINKFIHFNNRANKVFEDAKFLNDDYSNRLTSLDKQTRTTQSDINTSDAIRPNIKFTIDTNKPQSKKVTYTSTSTGDNIEGTFLESYPSIQTEYTYNKFGDIIHWDTSKSTRNIPFYISGDAKVADAIYKDYLHKNSIIGENGIQAGSSVVYSSPKGPVVTGIPADSEFLTTAQRSKQLLKDLDVYNTKQTSTVLSGDSHKIKGKVEIEIIEQGSTPNTSKGTIAEELYHILNPSGYQQLLRSSAVDTQGRVLSTPKEIEVPMSPEDLYQAFRQDPQLMRLKTILDNVKSGKGKHNSRVLTILNEHPSDIDRVVDILGEGYFGRDFKMMFDKSMSNIDFTNIEKNKEFLNKLDLPESWASDSDKMKALYKVWKIQQSATTRGVAHISGEPIETGINRLLQNFGRYYYSGSGGNTVQNSKVGGGYEYSFNGIQGIIYTPLSYKEDTFTNVMDGYNAVKRQNIKGKSQGIFSNNQSYVETNTILNEVNTILGSNLSNKSTIAEADQAIINYVNNELLNGKDYSTLEASIKKVSELLDLPSIRNHIDYYNVNQDISAGGYVGRLQGKTNYYTYTGNYAGTGQKSRLEPGGLFPNTQERPNQSTPRVGNAPEEVRANFKEQRNNLRKLMTNYENGIISENELPEELQTAIHSKWGASFEFDEIRTLLDDLDKLDDIRKEISIIKNNRDAIKKRVPKIKELQSQYNNIIDNIKSRSIVGSLGLITTGILGGLISNELKDKKMRNTEFDILKREVLANSEKFKEEKAQLDSLIKDYFQVKHGNGSQEELNNWLERRDAIQEIFREINEPNEEQSQDNKYEFGGPIKSDTANTFLTDWYSNPVTKTMLQQIENQNGLPQSNINKEVQTALNTPQYILEDDKYNPIPSELLDSALRYNPSFQTIYQRPENLSQLYRTAKTQKEKDELLRQDKLNQLMQSNIGGVYIPQSITPNKGILYRKDWFSPSLQIHELDHSIQDRLPSVLNTTIPVEHKLKNGIKPDSYLDSPEEIRSRIMQLRFINNLSPEKRDYKAKDAKKFIGKVKDKQLKKELERMDYQTVADYLNYMADNSSFLDTSYLS